MDKLKAFHGDKKIKEKYIARVKAHQKADEIIQGQYWQNGKGCAVGCTVETSERPHDQFQKELGISWRLALIEDSIFEKLKNGEAKKFPLQFLQSVKVGSDTNLVHKKFVIWVLGDKKTGLVNVIKDEKVVGFLKRVLELYKKSLKVEIKESEWKTLADEACYAYTSAYTYTYTYAYTYAYTYTYTYAYTSAYAYAYASGTFDQKVFDKRILQIRNKLLSLLKSAK